MRLGLLGAVALALASLVAACIPTRDNRNDPAVAPNATLVLSALAGPGCPPLATLTTAGFNAVSAPSRGRCLALDSRATRDPQGDPVAFQWEYALSGGEFASLPAGASLSSLAGGALEVLAPAFVRTLPVDPSDVRFRVIARDPHGNAGIASISVSLENGRPLAIADAPRTLPLGGYPWAPGAPFDVPLSCARSVDPDGDPLSCTWTFLDGTPSVQTSAGGVVTVSVPSSPARTIEALLIASDGLLASSKVPAVIRIGKAAPWTAVANFVGLSAEAIDVDRGDQDATFGDYLSSESLFTVTGPQEFVQVRFPESTLRPSGISTQIAVAAWPPPTTLTTAAVISAPWKDGVARTEPDADRLDVWSLALPGSTHRPNWTDSQLSLYDWNGVAKTLSTPIVAAAPLPSCSMPYSCTPRLANSGAGDVWMLAVGSTSMALARSDSSGFSGAMETRSVGPTSVYVAANVRFLSRELWTAVEPEDGTLGTARIEVYDPSTTPATVLHVIETDRPRIRGILFAGPDEFWAVEPDNGIRLVDAALLSGGATWEEATIVFVPLQSGVSGDVVDHEAGSLWVALNDPATLHLEKSGQATLIPAAAAARFEDLDGGLLFESFPDGTSGVRAHSPDPSGVAVRAPKPAGAFPTLDGVGGAYVYIPNDRVVLHTAQDGEISDVISSVATPQEVAFPVAFPVTVSPDGRWMWTLESDPGAASHSGVYRYDLSTRPPMRSPEGGLPGSAALADAIDGSGDLLIPSAPGAARDFAWILKGTKASGSLLTGNIGVLTTDGVEDVRLAIPASELGRAFDTGSLTETPRRFARASRSQATNRLCFATLDPFSGALNVRWIEPFGAVAPLVLTTSEAVPASTANIPVAQKGLYLAAVATGRSANGGDACWVSLTAAEDACPSAVQPYQTTGQTWVVEVDSSAHLTRHAGPLAGLGDGLYVEGSNRVWMSMYRCSALGDTEKARVEFFGATGSEVQTLPIGGGRGFVVP